MKVLNIQILLFRIFLIDRMYRIFRVNFLEFSPLLDVLFEGLTSATLFRTVTLLY